MILFDLKSHLFPSSFFFLHFLCIPEFTGMFEHVNLTKMEKQDAFLSVSVTNLPSHLCNTVVLLLCFVIKA